MTEWCFDAAGDVSPRQAWDLASGSVLAGAARTVVKPEDPDFELLRPSFGHGGRVFPGEFAYSPDDGAALLRPAGQLVRVGRDNLPTTKWSTKAVFAEHERLVACPAGVATHAGDPATGLICNLTAGVAYRWSSKAEAWRETAPVPAVPRATALNRPGAIAGGFAYVGTEGGVAVLRPGHAGWQTDVKSPDRRRPLAPVTRLPGGGAAILAKTFAAGKLRLLVWSTEAQSWSDHPLQGEAGGGEEVYGEGLVLADDVIAWSRTSSLFKVATKERTAVSLAWPTGFTPLLAVPVCVGGLGERGLYQLGQFEERPTWAFAPMGGGKIELASADSAATPFNDGFLDAAGFHETPGDVTEAGMKLPSGCVGKPLARLRDGVLFLAIKAGENLWMDALAQTRRARWVSLIVATASGEIQKVGPEVRCGRVDGVQAVLLDNHLAVLGLHRGYADVWRVQGLSSGLGDA